MKRLFAALAVALCAAPFVGVAQDQPLYPVLMDSGNVIIRPNPQVFAAANSLVMTTDAMYAFFTNATLVSAATGAVTSIATLEATITNLAASAVTSGNIAVARITNAAATVGASIGGNVPIAALTNALAANLGTVDYTNVIVSADAKTNTIIVINGLVTSWVVTE